MRVTTLIVLLLAFVGCTYRHGNRKVGDEKARSELKEGMSKDEIRALIGDPSAATFDPASAREIWSYQLAESYVPAAQAFIPLVGPSLAIANSKHVITTITILFDDDDKLLKVTSTKSTGGWQPGGPSQETSEPTAEELELRERQQERREHEQRFNSKR